MAFRDAFQDAADGIVLVDAASGVCVDCNRTAAAMAGVSREELLAQGPARWGGPGIEKVVSAHPGSLVDEFDLERPDGSRISLETTHRAYRSEDRWFVAVTAREAADKALQRKLQLFRSAMDHVGDALLLVDRETMQVIDANITASTRAQVSHEEYLRLPPWGRSPKNTREEYAAIYDEAIAMSPDVQHDLREFVTPSGRVYPAEITRRAVRIDGRWVMVICSRDVTERQRAEAELHRRMADLARSNKDLERFAYVASHDLMEPLRMVSSYGQLLERRYKDRLDDDARDFIGFMVDGANRMMLLIEDLLAYSRAGRNAGEAQLIDMEGVLGEVRRNLERLIEDKSAIVEHGPLPELVADRTSMMQLLQNLVGNALKFQAPGVVPRVRVEARDAGAEWEFSVSDNGIGIEPQYFERIFEVFQRLHGRDSYGGNGIGLAICKKIVGSHGGRIWPESPSGGGCTFRFTIPKKPADRPPA